jgi:hypothetical protein
VKTRHITILASVYFISFFFGSALFVLFLRQNILHSLDVLFYRAVFILCISCTICGFGMFYAKKINFLKGLVTNRDIIVVVIILFFANYNFYGLVPFNVSRSSSVLLIGYLEKNNGIPKSEDEITRFIINKYFYDYRAISLRLKEQLSSGNIEKVGDGYVITRRGKALANLLRKISDMYKVNNNFLKT